MSSNVAPVIASANTTIMNGSNVGLISVGNVGVVNQVGVPLQVISSSSASGTSKPLPPFMIPLAPLDDEDSTGSHQPSTSHNYDISALQNYQALAMKSNVPVYHGISPPRKRSLNLIEEDPGAPSGYKRYKRGSFGLHYDGSVPSI